jgi:hypothetical protein
MPKTLHLACVQCRVGCTCKIGAFYLTAWDGQGVYRENEPHYFRKDEPFLYLHSPTWFDSTEEAIGAAQRMGFEVT